MVVVKAIAIGLGPTATYLVYALASCVALRKYVTLSLVLALTQDTRDFFSRSAKIHLASIICVHGLSYASTLLVLYISLSLWVHLRTRVDRA